MQERHKDRQLYFEEQGATTLKYVIPYLNRVKPLQNEEMICEIGCGEGGNLKPFLDQGYQITGIDINAQQIENAHAFYQNHPNRNNLKLICCDIYQVDPETLPKFDVLILRDVIEHIPNQERFFNEVKNFMKPQARLFIAFPPWRMPFGGHQQICTHRILSKLPWIHLLPASLYRAVLQWGKESPEGISELLELKKTGISIRRYHKLLKKTGFKITAEDCFLINPNYEIKFRLKPRKLYSIFKIPYLSDFYTTAIYSVIEVKQ